ncbi:Furin [Thelohanellus kitauei]|uniref:Furin n=1 Tax=Thelohanellus kitauei TaxID=669202 RepID=A0A0C2MUW7_THEKT|nr:Furin [Thelohanellus kitauei]
MVELTASTSYKRLSPARICITSTFKSNIVCDGKCVIHSTIFTSGCLGLTSALDTAEVVIVTLSVKSTVRGSLNIVLTSPTGTRVPLLEPRPQDTSNEALTDWDIKLLTTYNEKPYGYWKLGIDVPDGVTTTLVSWRVTIHGRVQYTDSSSQYNITKTAVCKEGYDTQNPEIQKLCTGEQFYDGTSTEAVDPFSSEHNDVEVIKPPRTWLARYGWTIIPISSFWPWVIGQVS